MSRRVEPASDPFGRRTSGWNVTLEAVVFDFDGLMVDTEWAIYETSRVAFAEHGHELTVEAWATVVGINDDSDQGWWSGLLAAAGIEAFERERFDAVYSAQDRSNREALPMLAGVEVLIDSLTSAGFPIGIASSSSLAWLDRHTLRLGVAERFGAIIGADTVGGVGKPAPDVYLRACADLCATPGRSVALEDSAHGVTAAKAAGMLAVAVPSRITRFNDFTHADLVVASLADLSVADIEALVSP